MRYRRVNLKFYLIASALCVWLIKRRADAVDEFDRLKRYEQKAMQNTEVDEVFGKKVSFNLF